MPNATAVEGQGVGATLRSLGDPVDLAKTYRAGNSRARAECSKAELAAGLLLKYPIDLTARWWIRRYRQQDEIQL